MLTEKEIIKIANDYVTSLEDEVGETLIAPEELMIKKPYGIYFIYHSKIYYETKNSIYKLLGSAPFLVENKTGKIIEFGTAHNLEFYIKEYESGRYPR
ncbi:hypothetical protein SAMN05443633_102387 [Chryseobacterium arachidis]|uniref:Immunity protein 35 n=1 Tax=Chryseobacterium arachidis TaxID=1416778 RepID=A0A1M4XPG8_9FLAO|nr:hypothetical protein [Chryseobacterium arachidis]SHE95399.1 hypothetical protein SAMN05443633_102387 [Chryseobacterium arachidis]